MRKRWRFPSDHHRCCVSDQPELINQPSPFVCVSIEKERGGIFSVGRRLPHRTSSSSVITCVYVYTDYAGTIPSINSFALRAGINWIIGCPFRCGFLKIFCRRYIFLTVWIVSDSLYRHTHRKSTPSILLILCCTAFLITHTSC